MLANEIDILDKARQYYFKSIENEIYLSKSIDMFEKLKSQSEEFHGLADTYLGSLTMLKGKYAFWPLKKMEYVDKGLIEMEKGLDKDPQNIESLFIFGSTCYYLPFFLGKKELAVEKLRNIIPLLNAEIFSKYKSEVISDVLTFLKENIELSKKEREKIDTLLYQLVIENE